MLKVDQARLDEMEKKYPGITEQILYFENAKLPACFGCGSEDTADVQRGLIGRTVQIAVATTKFKLIPGGPAPNYFCNTCGRFFYWPGEGHGVFDTEEVLRRIALREERGQCQGAESRITEALTALLGRSTEDSWVVVKEPKSEKFVQFGKGRIRMDVPFIALTREEAERAYRFFDELGEKYPHEYHARDLKTGKIQYGAAFKHDFRKNAKAAAKAAIEFFVNVYGCRGKFNLAIEQH